MQQQQQTSACSAHLRHRRLSCRGHRVVGYSSATQRFLVLVQLRPTHVRELLEDATPLHLQLVRIDHVDLFHLLVININIESTTSDQQPPPPPRGHLRRAGVQHEQREQSARGQRRRHEQSTTIRVAERLQVQVQARVHGQRDLSAPQHLPGTLGHRG